MAGRYTVDLKNKVALDRNLTGGKGAGCARLLRYGFDVPHGFVVTTDAFREFMSFNGMQPQLSDRSRLDTRLKQTRESIMDGSFPDAMRQKIVRSYQRLGGRVAVRSSMQAEDGSTTSYAGQLESILNVEGAQAVLDGIKKCYASLYSKRLMRYREHQGFCDKDDRSACEMAVVIQEMIDAHASGVLFTADPLTGQRCVVIESTPGVGEGVVNGLVDADRYIVDVRGRISEQRFVSDHGVLSQQQVIDLAKLANRISDCMDQPQDIEWAWDGRKYYFLQSRPITTLLEKRIYSRRLVSDMAPGLIKPLVWSTNTVGMMRNVFGRLFSHLTDVRNVRFESCVRRVASRLYADMTAFGELLERIGLPANFFEVVTRDEKDAQRRPTLNWRLVRTCLRSMPFILRHARYAGAINRYIADHGTQLQEIKAREYSSFSEQALISAAEELIAMHGRSQWHMWIATMNMMVRNRILNTLAKKVCAGSVPSNLLRGLDGLKALTPNDEIEKLAEQAAQLSTNIHRLFLTGDDKRIREVLATTTKGMSFLERVEAFLDTYGFLSANGTDFTIATWREDPAFVWKALGRAVKTHARRTPVQIMRIRDKERTRIRTQMNPLARVFFDDLLRSTLLYVDLRERMSLMMSKDAYEMRRIFRFLGARFAARRDLEYEDDIFHLYFDEIKKLINGSMPAAAARKTVMMRKANMERDEKVEPEETLIGDAVSEDDISSAGEDEFLTGIGGCSGFASGRARIVLDPANAPADLSQDDILVVPFTDIGWTPLFMGIGGIVAETGGQLSHTSIIAREYGLPAVVSVKNATRYIKDGQRIGVDGRDGRVYINMNRARRM